MYNPEHFKENDQSCLYNTIKEIQVAHLITQHSHSVEASFIPLYLDESQENTGVLYGHIAKANPQCQEPLLNPEALVIFTGANHYITPSWYPAKQTHHKVVPTWNYVTIHVRGKIEFIQDSQQILNIVTILTNIHEQELTKPWHITDAPKEYIQAMLNAIIGFKITINTIEGKYKLSQNQNTETQHQIIENLKEIKNTNTDKLSLLMQSHINKLK